MIITIDGPVASGKSTIARILAHELHYYYVCSGLLYRALSYVLIKMRGYTVENLDCITQKDIEYCLDTNRFLYCYDEHHYERVFFDNKDITPYLKDQLIDKGASIVSVNKDVRYAITRLQRIIAVYHDIVTDGRDVGSSVFPDAQYKFYITACVEVRAQRWRKDQEKYGYHVSQQQAIAIITDRDDRDIHREIAPLIIPEGAIVIDTSDVTIEHIVGKILEIVLKKIESFT